MVASRPNLPPWARHQRSDRAPLPALDPQLRRELTLPQSDDILRLQDLIGRDLTHWLAE